MTGSQPHTSRSSTSGHWDDPARAGGPAFEVRVSWWTIKRLSVRGYAVTTTTPQFATDNTRIRHAAVGDNESGCAPINLMLLLVIVIIHHFWLPPNGFEIGSCSAVHSWALIMPLTTVRRDTPFARPARQLHNHCGGPASWHTGSHVRHAFALEVREETAQFILAQHSAN